MRLCAHDLTEHVLFGITFTVKEFETTFSMALLKEVPSLNLWKKISVSCKHFKTRRFFLKISISSFPWKNPDWQPLTLTPTWLLHGERAHILQLHPHHPLVSYLARFTGYVTSFPPGLSFSPQVLIMSVSNKSLLTSKPLKLR